MGIEHWKAVREYTWQNHISRPCQSPPRRSSITSAIIWIVVLGGAILFFGVTGNIVVVKDSHFLNNWAMNGGVVRFDKSSISVSSFPLLFENNVGTKLMEALYLY